jgi:hypothetical protein
MSSTASNEPEWKQQLDMCVAAAYDVSKPWAEGVREQLIEDRTPTFQRNESQFPLFKEQILNASRLTGEVARLCANFQGLTDVSWEAMEGGIAAASKVCTAGQVNVRYLWCE